MEVDTDWTTSTLYSPSKAQAHQAQAKDWASVEAWLARRYASKRLPVFERNEETLRALLTLAISNEGADEQRGHIDRIEKAALSAQSKRSSTVDQTYQVLLAHSDDSTHIDALAQTAVELGCYDVGAPEMCAALIDLTSKRFTISQAVQRAESQISLLKAEQHHVRNNLDELHGPSFQAHSDLPREISEDLRSAKQMRAKVAEYDDRLTRLQSAPFSRTRLENVAEQTEALKAQSAYLKQLHAELDAYQNLPSSSKAARTEVTVARDELRRLTTERDGLFEGLADFQ